VTLQPARPVDHATAPRDQLGTWIDAVAGALLALHWAGIVHGGVLEADVVTVDGELRVGGGGVWACADPAALARVVGTAPIAPERRAGARASAASDAWSLGALIARWVGGAGPDPLLATMQRHPKLATELGPMLADDPVRRRHDLIDFVASARAALATPFADDVVAQPRGRRRKNNTTEERTEVGHASGIHRGGEPSEPARDAEHDAEPTERSAPPVAATPRAVIDVASAPILAVSMKPGGPGGRPFEQPTPPAPTPQLQRPILRAPTREDEGRSLGRLAPPRAVVEAERRQTRRVWLIVLIALLAVAVGVMAVLVVR